MYWNCNTVARQETDGTETSLSISPIEINKTNQQSNKQTQSNKANN